MPTKKPTVKLTVQQATRSPSITISNPEPSPMAMPRIVNPSWAFDPQAASGNVPPRPPRRAGFDPASSHAAGIPIKLVATGTVHPNGSVSIPGRALMNPNQSAMLIDRILFFSGAPQLASAPAAFGTTLGGVIACDFALGNRKLTASPVPIWLFDPTINLPSETPAITNIVGNLHQWTPRHPIYVPPGEYLSPTFFHRGFLNSDILVGITYEGRSLPRGVVPENVAYPYVATYISDAMAFDGATHTAASVETDLNNDSDSPLHVDYFTGEAMMFLRAIVLYYVLPSWPPIANQFLLTMARSDGYEIVRDPLYLHQIFNPHTRRMEILNHTMPPKSYYNVGVTLNTAAALNNAVGQVQIAMIGWRE